MTSTQSIHHQRVGFGRVALWAVLILTLVFGSMFLIVGLFNTGDTRTGGFMFAVPCAIVAAICASALRNGNREG